MAHRTFWAAASRGGHTLVVTLFQIHEPTEAAAKALLTWAFANRARVTPVGTLVAPAIASDPAPSSSSDSGSTLSASSSHGTTSVSFTALPKRGLALGASVVALLGGGAWWWLRRRDRASAAPVSATPSIDARPSFEPGGHVSAGPRLSPPASTTPAPVRVLPGVPTVEPVLAPPSEASPMTHPPQAAPAGATSTEATADDTSPIPVVEPAQRPAPVGNVRIVRPGRPPED